MVTPMSELLSDMKTAQGMIARLQHQSAFPSHQVDKIQLLQTHCAWVILTGPFAYKIKKPVNYGFLDFSSLEKRHYYCQQEVALNQRFSPDIYLGVEKITGTANRPVIGSSSKPAIEYAIKMKQFPCDCLLSDLARRQALSREHIDPLVDTLADFHATAAVAERDSPFGTIATIRHWMLENFDHLLAADHSASLQNELDEINRWVTEQLARLEPVFNQRKKSGQIRNCHGDLHLKNLTVINGKVKMFDCIEFNEALRWIDLVSEIAFLIMDLQEQGYPQLSSRFLNRYLQKTGDYAGLEVLPFYLVYRAMVRAKVAVLRMQQVKKGAPEYLQAERQYRQYIAYVRQKIMPTKPKIVITCGVSGSGKSTLASQLCESLGWIQIRSDIERKRLAGLTPLEKSKSAIDAGIYSPAQTLQTYRYLAQLADQVTRAGFSVIVDATFLKSAQRRLLEAVARDNQRSFYILNCVAPESTLRERITYRKKNEQDASEATPAVLSRQQRSFEPFSLAEQPQLFDVDTTSADSTRRLIEQLRHIK